MCADMPMCGHSQPGLVTCCMAGQATGQDCCLADQAQSSSSNRDLFSASGSLELVAPLDRPDSSEEITLSLQEEKHLQDEKHLMLLLLTDLHLERCTRELDVTAVSA